MRIIPFFRSPIGNIVLFCAFVGFGALLMLRGNARERAQTSKQMTRVESAPPRAMRESISRNSLPFRPIPAALVKKSPVDDAKPDLGPPQAERAPRRGAVVARPAVLPISLFTTVADTTAGPLSKTYAPYGR